MTIHQILKTLEYLLILLISVCLCYALYFLLFQNSTFRYQAVSLEGEDVKDYPIEPIYTELKSYDYYSRDIETRNIFKPPKEVKTKKNTETLSGRLPAHMKVVGIVFADPAQVVIEDKKTNETYFIKQDMPVNGIRIKRVYTDKIILEYQQQNVEINLRGNQIHAPTI